MKPLPLTPELERVARNVIWFENPERALSDPIRFAAYAMTYGGYEEMEIVRKYLSDEDLREALANAPPGIMDGRSWAYWHLIVGEYPPPSMPTRKLSGGRSC